MVLASLATYLEVSLDDVSTVSCVDDPFLQGIIKYSMLIPKELLPRIVVGAVSSTGCLAAYDQLISGHRERLRLAARQAKDAANEVEDVKQRLARLNARRDAVADEFTTLRRAVGASKRERQDISEDAEATRYKADAMSASVC